MTEQSKAVRPSQVTMAGWVALVGSVLMVLTLFDSVSRLRTVEFRDSIDEFLSTPPGNGLGLEVAQVQEILRAMMLFSGAAAAAATVLAIYVLQRHNAARIGFTIAAVAIMITAPVSGGFLPVMIAFSAMMLWTRPARDWFAGVPTTRSGERLDDQRGRSATFAAHQAGHRAEGNLLSSENHPRDEQPDSTGNAPGTSGQGDQGGEGDRTAPWPRMPEESSGRPLPPPSQGFGTPPGQGQAPQEGAVGGAQQPPPPVQAGGPSYPHGGPTYPQGGYPPPPYQGAQPPYQGGQPHGPQPGHGQPHPGAQPPYGAPYGQQPYGYPPQYGASAYGQPPHGAFPTPGSADARPRTVSVAAWVTWALSALSVLTFVLIGFVLGVAREDFLDQLEADQNFQQLDIPTDQVVAALWVMGAVALFWGLAAMVLAWFAYRRANWARITLVVSSGFTVLFSLLTFPLGLLHTLGAGAVIVLLFTGGANEWYARGSGGQGHPGAFQPYGPPQQVGGQQYGQPGQPGQPGQQYGGQQPPQGQVPQGEPSRGAHEPTRERGKDDPPPNVW